MKKNLFKRVVLGVSGALFAGVLFFNSTLVENESGDSLVSLTSLQKAHAQDDEGGCSWQIIGAYGESCGPGCYKIVHVYGCI